MCPKASNQVTGEMWMCLSIDIIYIYTHTHVYTHIHPYIYKTYNKYIWSYFVYAYRLIKTCTLNRIQKYHFIR